MAQNFETRSVRSSVNTDSNPSAQSSVSAGNNRVDFKCSGLFLICRICNRNLFHFLPRVCLFHFRYVGKRNIARYCIFPSGAGTWGSPHAPCLSGGGKGPCRPTPGKPQLARGSAQCRALGRGPSSQHPVPSLPSSSCMRSPGSGEHRLAVSPPASCR